MPAEAEEQARYVALLEEMGVLGSETLRQAFAVVRRHRFLDGWYRLAVGEDGVPSFEHRTFDLNRPSPEDLQEIYSNRALVTAVEGWQPTSSTSQLALVARMLSLLDPRAGHSVMEIGTGTGYNAALLREVVGTKGRVCTLEIQKSVAKRAEQRLADEGYADVAVLAGDAYCGGEHLAPYDRILATAGCSDVSPHWMEQLTPEGCMLLPLQHGFGDPLVRIERDPSLPGSGVGRVVGDSNFMPIRGELRWRSPWDLLLTGGLSESPDRVYPLPAGLGKDGSGRDASTAADRLRSYSFFLSLTARVVRYPGIGVGISEPATGSVALVMDEAINGYAGRGHTRSLDALYDRLAYLSDAWRTLGCPAPEDYVLRFVPRTQVLDTKRMSDRYWVIDRLDHFEIVELCS